MRYLSHPQVRIDPAIAVDRWSLNAVGLARVAALASAIRSGRTFLQGTTQIISSAETKALQTAAPLAEALGATLQVRPLMHENDRSATGYLPAAEFEAMEEAFFAHPDQSVRGWETARAAQARILAETRSCLGSEGAVPDANAQDYAGVAEVKHETGDVLIAGHGAVGSLLYCALSGQRIDRKYDQPPGGGHFWAFERESLRPLCAWTPMEDLMPWNKAPGPFSSPP